MSQYRVLEKRPHIKFAEVLPKEPIDFCHNDVTIQYVIYKDHLFVKGSMYLWNWDSSFNKATKALISFLSIENEK